MNSLRPLRCVSVIVATRDRPALLREALASIRALEGPDVTFEILVGDNGTALETASIVSEFGGIYLRTSKNGCAAARNIALDKTSGEFIAFLDDDDLWLPENIRPHIALLDANPDFAAVVGQVVSTDCDRRPITEPWPNNLPEDGDFFTTMINGYAPQVGATVVRASVARKYGAMDETLIGGTDWDWQIRIARDNKIGFVRKVCVLFRQREPASFYDLQRKRARFARQVFFRHAWRSGKFTPREMYSAYRNATWQFFKYFTDAAIRYRKVGEYGKARRSFLDAFIVIPPFTAKRIYLDSDLRSAFLEAFGFSRFSKRTHEHLPAASKVAAANSDVRESEKKWS